MSDPGRTARAFPWGSLESTTRQEVASLQRARSWATQTILPERWGRALSERLGIDCAVRVRRAGPFSPALPFGEGLGVLLSTGDDSTSHPATVLQVEAALATSVVARVLRRTPPAVVGGPRGAAAPLAGAFAAVVVSALRQAHGTVPARVVLAGDANTTEREALKGGRDWTAVTLTVLIGDEAYAARVLVLEHALATAGVPAFCAQHLRRLDAVPLAMPIVAAVLTMSATEWAELEDGDVLVPYPWPLPRRHAGAGAAGPVLLAPPSAVEGVTADVDENGRVVLRGDVEVLAPQEDTMADADGNAAIIRAVGEIPVVVRVEVGEVRMPAREWASLVRGDVLTLGRRIGERVALRVGGVVMAHGDLVDVDGEVGVRIVERGSEDPTLA